MPAAETAGTGLDRAVIAYDITALIILFYLMPAGRGKVMYDKVQIIIPFSFYSYIIAEMKRAFLTAETTNQASKISGNIERKMNIRYNV